jgi:hypothetical protein
MALNYEKLTHLSLKTHSTLDEKWVQDRIAEDPTILGLGDVILKDRERNQPRAGRLDLLLQEADELLGVLKPLDPTLELKFNKFYIGLARQGQADNFVIFRPQKTSIRVEPRLKKRDEIEQKIEAAGLDVLDYDNRWNRYRIRLGKGDVKKHAELLQELFSAAHSEAGGNVG